MWILGLKPFDKFGNEPGNWQAIEVLVNSDGKNVTGNYNDLFQIHSKEEARIWIDMNGGGKIVDWQFFSQLSMIQMEEHDQRVRNEGYDKKEVIDWVKSLEDLGAVCS